MAGPSPWTPDITAYLLQLDVMAETDPKITFGVIADRINAAFGTNFSRNAVAGQLHKLRAATRGGETRRRRPAKEEPEPEPAPEPAPRLIQRPPCPPPATAKAPEPAPSIAQPGQRAPVTLLERELWQCRWPVNDGNPYLFCGARKGDHDPVYCRHHRGVATGRAWSRSAAGVP